MSSFLQSFANMHEQASPSFSDWMFMQKNQLAHDEIGIISCTIPDNSIDKELYSFVSKPPNHVQYNSIYYCILEFSSHLSLIDSFSFKAALTSRHQSYCFSYLTQGTRSYHVKGI